MTISCRDFRAIAQALLAQDPRRSGDNDREMLLQWQRDCNAVAYALSTLNPNFDGQRFLATCQATTELQP